MKWYWLISDPSKKIAFKSHAIPEPLRDEVITDLKIRGATALTCEETAEVHMELGGMCMVGRHHRVIVVDGLYIRCPSSHVSGMLAIAEKAIIRGDSNPYYKLHYWFERCLVLQPNQHTTWVRALRECLGECEAIESAENNEFNQRFSGVSHPHVLIQERPVKKPVGRG